MRRDSGAGHIRTLGDRIEPFCAFRQAYAPVVPNGYFPNLLVERKTVSVDSLCTRLRCPLCLRCIGVPGCRELEMANAKSSNPHHMSCAPPGLAPRRSMKELTEGLVSALQSLIEDYGFQAPIHMCAIARNGAACVGTYSTASEGLDWEGRYFDMVKDWLLPINMMFVDDRGEAASVFIQTRTSPLIFLH